MEAEAIDDTCDLCYGKGLLICDGCNGTTYLDGNQWTVCGKCAGAGKSACTLCNGAGSNPCESCGGSGLDETQEDGKCWGCHGKEGCNVFVVEAAPDTSYARIVTVKAD